MNEPSRIRGGNRARQLRFGAIVVLSSLAGAALAAGAPQAVGITSAVLNDVSIKEAGTTLFRHAILRQRVALADQVQTGARSQLQVLLLDKSVFNIGANARLTIDRYVYDPTSGRSFGASVAKGAFRFMSGRPDRSGNSSINTPVASIGIRGTVIDGVVGAEAIGIANGERGIGQNRNSDPLTATLVILRGPGQRTQGNVIPGEITVTAAGKTVSLDRPMLAAYVPRSGAEPIGPFTISNSGLARVQALIFPSLAEWAAATAPVGHTPYPGAPPRQVRRRPPGMGFPVDGDAGGRPQIPAYGVGTPSMPQVPGGRPVSAGQTAPAAVAKQPATIPQQTRSTSPQLQPADAQPLAPAAAQPATDQQLPAKGSQMSAPAPQAPPAAGNPPTTLPQPKAPGIAPNGQPTGAGPATTQPIQSPPAGLRQTPTTPTTNKLPSGAGLPGKP